MPIVFCLVDIAPPEREREREREHNWRYQAGSRQIDTRVVAAARLRPSGAILSLPAHDAVPSTCCLT